MLPLLGALRLFLKVNVLALASARSGKLCGDGLCMGGELYPTDHHGLSEQFSRAGAVPVVAAFLALDLDIQHSFSPLLFKCIGNY
jgi:hypothetical protein